VCIRVEKCINVRKEEECVSERVERVDSVCVRKSKERVCQRVEGV